MNFKEYEIKTFQRIPFVSTVVSWLNITTPFLTSNPVQRDFECKDCGAIKRLFEENWPATIGKKYMEQR